jgi:hypothetical protein
VRLLLVSFISILVYLLLSIEYPKIFLVNLVIDLLLFYLKNTEKGTMAQNKLGEYAISNEDYIHAPITQPAVEAENYEIKPNYLSLVQQNQFGGSTSEDAGLHLNTFSEICDIMRIKDVNPNVVRLRLFPFSLREKAKDWLLLLPKGTITSWNACTSAFMSKFSLQQKLCNYGRKIISEVRRRNQVQMSINNSKNIKML